MVKPLWSYVGVEISPPHVLISLPFELTEICWDYPKEIDLVQFLNDILKV